MRRLEVVNDSGHGKELVACHPHREIRVGHPRERRGSVDLTAIGFEEPQVRIVAGRTETSSPACARGQFTVRLPHNGASVKMPRIRGAR